MQDINLHLITTDPVSLPACAEKRITLSVLRLDKIHPYVSGNKFFKLHHYLQEAKLQRKKTIVTYGGAWSNHILATAAACRLHQFHSIGIIRGERSSSPSATLQKAAELGMELIFLSRDEFNNQKRNPRYDNEGCYYISEGGFGIPGAEGAASITDHCTKQDYTHFCCAAGTGTMTAGLIKSTLSHQQVTSISVLKNNTQLETDIQQLTGHIADKLSVIHAYHFGGYAKYKAELIDFMNSFYRQTGIPTDFVYTGKLFFGLLDLITSNYFPSGSNMLVIHSGGLQGNASLKKGTLIF